MLGFCVESIALLASYLRVYLISRLSARAGPCGTAYRHIVAVQFLGAHHILSPRIHQRLQYPARFAHPIGQRQEVQFYVCIFRRSE